MNCGPRAGARMYAMVVQEAQEDPDDGSDVIVNGKHDDVYRLIESGIVCA